MNLCNDPDHPGMYGYVLICNYGKDGSGMRSRTPVSVFKAQRPTTRRARNISGYCWGRWIEANRKLTTRDSREVEVKIVPIAIVIPIDYSTGILNGQDFL